MSCPQATFTSSVLKFSFPWENVHAAWVIPPRSVTQFDNTACERIGACCADSCDIGLHACTRTNVYVDKCSSKWMCTNRGTCTGKKDQLSKFLIRINSVVVSPHFHGRHMGGLTMFSLNNNSCLTTKYRQSQTTYLLECPMAFSSVEV